MKQSKNNKNAFIFQGVGSEYKDYLHLLDDSQKRDLKKYCEIVHNEFGINLWEYLFGEADIGFDKMLCDWIAIYTCDYIVYRTYVDNEICPQICIGYSMGLITAMLCSEAISFETGLHMLFRIYQYPIDANRMNEGMAVIVGLTFEDIISIIESNNLNNEVEIGSENNDFCIILAGNKEAVSAVMKLAEAEGALKVKEINAPYAFHSHYAGIGIESYVEQVKKIQVNDSKYPIVSTFDKSVLQKASELKEELVKNMTGSMRWKSGIEKIASMGITSFVEVSLEESIVKFSKLINTDYSFLTYKKLLKAKAKNNLNKR